MAITLVGVGAQNAAITTPLSATLPAGVQADDLILLVIVSKGDRTVTPDAGYTLIADVLESSATKMRLTVSYKKAGASESDPSSSISSASSGWSVQTIVYRGVDTTTAQDATAVSSTQTTAATTWTPTGITTVTDNAVAVSIVGATDNDTLHFLSGSERSFTEEMTGGSYSTGVGTDHSLGVGDKTITTAGAVTCPTWEQTVNGPDVWAGLTVALRPAATGTDANISATAIAATVTVNDSLASASLEYYPTAIAASVTVATSALSTDVTISATAIAASVVMSAPSLAASPPLVSKGKFRGFPHWKIV